MAPIVFWTAAFDWLDSTLAQEHPAPASLVSDRQRRRDLALPLDENAAAHGSRSAPAARSGVLPAGSSLARTRGGEILWAMELLATTGDAFVRVGAHTRLQGSGAQCLALDGDTVYVGCRGARPEAQR